MFQNLIVLLSIHCCCCSRSWSKANWI